MMAAKIVKGDTVLILVDMSLTGGQLGDLNRRSEAAGPFLVAG